MLFNEPKLLKLLALRRFFQIVVRFSALQRAEIAETPPRHAAARRSRVSVLFNEPKLLKSVFGLPTLLLISGFSALQRAEIAEITD